MGLRPTQGDERALPRFIDSKRYVLRARVEWPQDRKSVVIGALCSTSDPKAERANLSEGESPLSLRVIGRSRVVTAISIPSANSVASRSRCSAKPRRPR